MLLGSSTVEHHHAIPLADILWLHEYMKNDQDEPMPIEQALLILRRTLFPFSYNPCPFVEGKVLKILFMCPACGRETSFIKFYKGLLVILQVERKPGLSC